MREAAQSASTTPESATQHLSDVLAPQKKGWFSSTLALVILLSGAGLVMAFTWFSILFIFNPAQIGWLNKFLPEWAQIPLGYSEPPQTLQQIQEKLSKQKQIAGKTLPLDDEENSLLLPIVQQRANCQSNCQEIVELRVYQRSTDLEFQSQSDTYFRLAHYLPITGPEESLAIAPLNNATSENYDANTPLPLTAIKRFEGDGVSPGIWFSLQGQRQQGTNAIAYGQIVYYNPGRTNLQQMLSWTNPNGQLPKWQQVTGGGAKELVIDRTVGLEPQLRVYQVKNVKLYLNPIQLEAISLQPPALKDSAYQNALLIARSGLWTPAFEWLQFIRKQRKGILPAAQAQIDVIRLHAQLSKAQAEKTWASPSQQVLAELIDGRWEKALQVFAASPQNRQEIATLLKADTGRLWNRTVAALQVKPDRPEVQAWAALILAEKQGEGRANSWLKARPKITNATVTYIQGLLKQLNEDRASQTSSHPSQIVGTVQPISKVNPKEWLPVPKADLTLTNNEVWYQVEVSAFNDGKRWLNSPFGNLRLPKDFPAKFLWETLGINIDPIIQIIVRLPNGEQQTTSATIKGVQLQNGVLRLLAAGEAIAENQKNVQPLTLALTANALEWVQPAPITLAELYQQNPRAVENILPIVWRSLQRSGQISDGDVPKFLQIQEQIGHWPVQVIDLTNDNKPETVLTVSQEAIGSLKDFKMTTQESEKIPYRSRTLILSDSGKVIYTDFQESSQQVLTAIAKISSGQSLALLVENANNYSLKRWSTKNQRFE
ncbi:hypothetical protein A6770_17270 [Nostoc minutum NIES-26]|uniref:Uncharacterized protein n=1 Tax=Nostoc minutum NIES-26 TaxID=1844469 RepID=A0A367RCM5_9NOSO|nr:hypothetical protein A6770_17270 [Nostoc minutum NIES-26]